MSEPPRHSVSVAGIVVDEAGRVLTIQRQDNLHWEPPGGVLEMDETPEAGTVREVLEETGIQVEVERLTGVYKNMQRGVIALVFRCKPVAGALSTSDESRRVAWKDRAAILEEMTLVYRVRVEDAFDCEHVAVRSHDGNRILSD
ncbi:ADP-ribose pyrophosphatase YjhB (NUDIX family) [Pseudonocardia autotrophica]|nr:ADP-ribose pyrophosphatase YjhB (NUDIX family) [Pseudonocardia autotrophica]